CASRRRHTRLVSDWSSDVCSSDLESLQALGQHRKEERPLEARRNRKRRTHGIDRSQRDELLAFLLEIEDARLRHRLERPGKRAPRAAGPASDPSLLPGFAGEERDDTVLLTKRMRRQNERVRVLKRHEAIMATRLRTT